MQKARLLSFIENLRFFLRQLRLQGFQEHDLLPMEKDVIYWIDVWQQIYEQPVCLDRLFPQRDLENYVHREELSMQFAINVFNTSRHHCSSFQELAPFKQEELSTEGGEEEGFEIYDLLDGGKLIYSSECQNQ